MKAILTLYVDVGVIATLDRIANERGGTSRNAVAVEALTRGLPTAGSAREGPQQPRHAEKPLTRWEEAALAAVGALEARYAALEPGDLARGNRTFRLQELAHAAGLYPSQALVGLRGLERRKVLRSVMVSDMRVASKGEKGPDLEHWTRAVVSAR